MAMWGMHDSIRVVQHGKELLADQPRLHRHRFIGDDKGQLVHLRGALQILEAVQVAETSATAGPQFDWSQVLSCQQVKPLTKT